MARYFYAWTPLVLVGTVFFLSLPWLGLLALVVFALLSLAVLATLVWAIVAAPLAVGHAIARQWRERGVVSHPPATLSRSSARTPYATIGERRSGGVR